MDDLNTAFQNANDFYIHYNKINIGNKVNKTSLSQSFAQQKQIIATQVKSQYIKLFDANINNEKSIHALAAAMDLTQQDFLTMLNNQLVNKLQKQISIDKLQTLYTGVKSGDINKYLNNAVQHQSIEDLRKAFEGLSQALSLLDNKTNGLGALLLNSTNNAFSFSDVGVNLSKELEKYKVNNNYRLIRRQSLQAAKKQLQNLAYVLQTGTFKTGGDLTARGLSTLLLNGLISTQIAEGLAFSASGKAGSLLYKTILEAVGTQNVEVKSDSSQSIKITGKTDVRAKGVQISLQGVDQGDSSGSIKLNIGISSKFYTGQGFNEKLEEPKGIYGSGSGGTLGQAIMAIWGDPIDRYLVYNYFPHEMYQTQLNDLIATRQIIRLFASAGSESDFANFMLVNGRIVSIWEIVKYAISSNLGLSKSLGGEQNQGIILSIPGRVDIKEANVFEPRDKNEFPIVQAWKRSRKVNSVINSTRIYAELHLKNLMAAMPQSV